MSEVRGAENDSRLEQPENMNLAFVRDCKLESKEAKEEHPENILFAVVTLGNGVEKEVKEEHPENILFAVTSLEKSKLESVESLEQPENI